MLLDLESGWINLDLVPSIVAPGDDPIALRLLISVQLRVPPGPALDRLRDWLDRDADGPDLDRRLGELAGGES